MRSLWRRLGDAGRIFAFLSLAFGLMRFVRLSQPLALGAAAGKLIGGSLAVELGVLGVIGAALHSATRRGGDSRAAVALTLAAGSAGAALAADLVRRTTADHDGFARAFGPDWRSRVPAGLSSRFLPSRRSLFLPCGSDPRLTRGLAIADADSAHPLRANLWLPPTGVSPSGLGLVYVNVGGWKMHTPDAIVGAMLRHLANQGHVVLSVDPRTPPTTDLPGMVADVRRAVSWLHANGPEHGVRPERVVVVGNSAGGHLAMLAAWADDPAFAAPDLAETSAVIRGVVAWYGPSDLAAYYAHNGNREQIEMLLGGLPSEQPERARRYSPISYMRPGLPPTLLFQGTHDSGVPVTATRQLRDRLVAAGVPTVYVEFPTAEHAFDFVLPRLAPAAIAALHDLDRFLGVLAGD